MQRIWQQKVYRNRARTFAEAQEMEKECVLFAKVKCPVGVLSNLLEIFLMDIIVCIESQQVKY